MAECKQGHKYTPDNTYVSPTNGQRHCRACRARHARTFYHNNREQCAEWHRKHYAGYRDKILAAKKRYRKAKRHITAQYSLAESFPAMVKRQRGKCAACGQSPRNGETLFVDHDHTCCPAKRKSCGRCVRGLICRHCNTALGMVEDSVERLVSLLNYLKGQRQR